MSQHLGHLGLEVGLDVGEEGGSKLGEVEVHDAVHTRRSMRTDAEATVMSHSFSASKAVAA